VSELKEVRSAASPANGPGGGFANDTRVQRNFWGRILCDANVAQELDADFEAMEKGTRLGTRKDAIYLPGWCGPDSDEHSDTRGEIGRRAF